MDKINTNLINSRGVYSRPLVSENLTLSRETLHALGELGDVIKSIKRRMYNEGYEVIDGKIYKRT